MAKRDTSRNDLGSISDNPFALLADAFCRGDSSRSFSKSKINPNDGTYISYNGLTFSTGVVDEFNNPVKRTKSDYPYSYDGFVSWRGYPNSVANATVYTDRLLHENWDKHDRLCQKHFGNEGQLWGQRDEKTIEAWLRDWFDDPELRLVFIMEYCNHSSGYPLWRFDFNSTKGEQNG